MNRKSETDRINEFKMMIVNDDANKLEKYLKVNSNIVNETLNHNWSFASLSHSPPLYKGFKNKLHCSSFNGTPEEGKFFIIA